MRKKLRIAAILTLTAVSLTMLTMTVLAGSRGNPGGDDSLHPDHSDDDHAANKIVHVPCATGSHHRHRGDPVDNPGPNHIHHSTYYWFDSDVDDSDPPPQRVVELRCGMHHDDDDMSITSWGNHGTVGWDSTTSKFTFSGDNDTGLGKFKDERVKYCNKLIDDGNNDGAYPPFNGVRDMCRQFFLDVEQDRPSSGGL